MSEIVQRRDLEFLMYEMFDLDTLLSAKKYQDHDRETISAMLDSAEAIAGKYYQPIAAEIDANEPKFINGRVEMHSGIGEALNAYAEAGFFSTIFDEDIGGLQLPSIVSLFANGIFSCANLSISNYAILTIGNANMLSSFGSEQQKNLYLPRMLEGRWFGTMCLSEPQAGSSLSDITTRAEPLEDGTYRVVGSKMWISGGDHDLTENISHMVLAKIPGSPEGVKGISLFLVPRIRVNKDGSLAGDNNVGLVGVNHKMGQRGTVNCLLQFSDGGDSIGTIVGEPGQGMVYMFHMMNEARLAVGHAAAMCGLGGYLYSLNYARERFQGRHPQNKDPKSAQVPIIEHADVKRMLLAQKAAVEGAMALTGYCALLVDRLSLVENASEKAAIHSLLGIITPIAKSWPSEHCLEANKHAIQVLGGYGYTREYPVERFYRDNRLNHIHEGSFGIQGIDLLGRKVRMNGGESLTILCSEISGLVAEASAIAELSEEAGELIDALTVLQKTTEQAIECSDMNIGLANATLYLDAFGHVIVAWLWLWQALIAQKALNSDGLGENDQHFYKGKLAAFRYFYRYELPTVYAKFDVVRNLDSTCASFDPDDFYVS